MLRPTAVGTNYVARDYIKEVEEKVEKQLSPLPEPPPRSWLGSFIAMVVGTEHLRPPPRLKCMWSGAQTNSWWCHCVSLW